MFLARCACSEPQAMYYETVGAIREYMESVSRPPVPADALMADHRELCMEEAEMARSRGVWPLWQMGLAPDMSYLCTENEKQYLDTYASEWEARTGTPAAEDPDCFFNLQDNPANRLSWSMNGRIPRFRHSGGKIYHPESGRFMTRRERLACLGIPVYECMATAARSPVILLESKAAAAMAGNAWHCCNAGLVMLVAMSCVESLAYA